MTRVERIARDLAAVLSPKGEADWQNYAAMAEEIGTKMFRQFAEIISSDAERIARHYDHHGISASR
jgi:histone H3/H4